MGMVINTNLSALNTWNQLNRNTNQMNSSLEKLSSGYKINSSSDDAAGLAISKKMINQINGLNQASDNAQNASSMVQTADGALEETNSILERMRELAVQSASDTNTDSDRSNIQDEVDALTTEINNIANTTEFNTKKLLNGNLSAGQNSATANVLSNSSILTAGSTLSATSATLSSLTDTAGNSLGIKSGDKITISYMKDGQFRTSTLTAATTTALSGLTAASVYNKNGVAEGNVSSDLGLTVSSTGSLQVTAATTGSSNAIYGLSITVQSKTTSTDSNGNTTTSYTDNTAATDALSSFTQTVAAKDKSVDGTATILIGANTGQDIKINIGNMDATSLGVQGIQVDTQAAANTAIKTIDTAVATVTAERAKLGAVVNRLSSTTDNLSTSSENLTSANSLIRDTDMASEMANYTKLSTLTQAATAMLAKANSRPQSVLTLLQS
ncbi:flagellin N-terminal helical domain-containing protein [Propionispora hippei]|uniref:Flagellin n=1 Tax=Propionispora hippei DSM 15287 TaxID=1123003 RepID=A0A1M6C2H2_9FIRM|nr:flagellin [Propionispora hippei]SHI54908.1 flagellin [Propionispora hippei DSM 15287]